MKKICGMSSPLGVRFVQVFAGEQVLIVTLFPSFPTSREATNKFPLDTKLLTCVSDSRPICRCCLCRMYMPVGFVPAAAALNAIPTMLNDSEFPPMLNDGVTGLADGWTSSSSASLHC